LDGVQGVKIDTLFSEISVQIDTSDWKQFGGRLIVSTSMCTQAEN
jgi:hypothetical protein